MSALAPSLLHWHARHGRHDLPWQQAPRSAYRVWLAEVMLQQTQVATVIPYYARFLGALPDLPALAAASEDAVLALWSGLGYYRRARHLHAAARLCMTQHAGDLPRDFDALAALPGIGRSTAGAILAQAWDLPFAILDGNVKRVLARYHAINGWPGQSAVTRELWRRAAAHTPQQRAGDYAQAIMDLGAMLCTPQQPDCPRCPLRASCAAHAQGLSASLPTPRPRRTLPRRRLHWLLLRDAQGRILLVQRDGDGIWPRLWSLPETAHAPEAHAASLAQLRAAPRVLPLLRHSFTHFQLEAQPLLFDGAHARDAVRDQPALGWYTPQVAATLALPAPVRRLLNQLPELP
ncbi:MAG: A/G-specific adenine glycosylase [Metallibacterium sp.]